MREKLYATLLTLPTVSTGAAKRAEDEKAKAEIQREFSEHMQSLEHRIDAARDKLGELKDASEDQLEQLRRRIDDWLPSNTN